jgi:hypothetical protein
MQAVHFTRFRVRCEDPEPVLKERRAWSSACHGDERFRGGLLVALEGGEWLDITVWEQTPPLDHGGQPQAPPLDFLDRVGGLGTEILGQECGLLALYDTRPDEPDASAAKSSGRWR